MGLPTWTCSFRRFGGFGVGRPSPSHRVPFFSTCGVEKPFSHVAFAFRDVSGWGNPPHHIAFAFSDVSGWGNPSRTSRSRFLTFQDGETLPVTSRSRFSDVLGWGNPLRHVAFAFIDVLGWFSQLHTSCSALSTFSIYIFCKLLIIYTFFIKDFGG